MPIFIVVVRVPIAEHRTIGDGVAILHEVVFGQPHRIDPDRLGPGDLVERLAVEITETPGGSGGRGIAEVVPKPEVQVRVCIVPPMTAHNRCPELCVGVWRSQGAGPDRLEIAISREVGSSTDPAAMRGV